MDDDISNFVEWPLHRTFAWDIQHYRVFRVPFTQRHIGVRRLRSLLNERFGWSAEQYRHKLR
jgi:hypothetical protein